MIPFVSEEKNVNFEIYMSSFENGGFFNYSSIIIGLNSTNIFMNFMTYYEIHFLVCNAVDNMYNARFFLNCMLYSTY